MNLNNKELGILLLGLCNWINNDYENRIPNVEKIALKDKLSIYMHELEEHDTNNHSN